MATELNGSSRIQDGSAEGLLQFLDYVVNRGYGTAAAVQPWRSAARQVLQTVEGSDDYGDVDVRNLDLDDYLGRFGTLARNSGKIKVESVQAYQRRFTNARNAYITFIAEGKAPTFRKGGKRQKAEPEAKPEKDVPAKPAPASSSAPAQQSGDPMIEYPFPLKSGQVAILRLPVRFEKADAERLSAFVRTLVLEPQLALPQGDASDDDEK